MKKLVTIILTLSFLVTTVGGAFAETSQTTTSLDSSVTVTTTTETTTPPTMEPQQPTTPPTIDTTTPPTIEPQPTTPAVIEVKAYPGTLKAIDFTAKKITVLHSNKKQTKEFVFEDTTKIVYKGKDITLAKLVVGSKVVVKYQLLSDKSVKVVTIQVVQMAVKKQTNKPDKKQDKKQVNNKKQSNGKKR